MAGLSLRGFTYQAIGQLAQRQPQAFAGRLDIATRWAASLARWAAQQGWRGMCWARRGRVPGAQRNAARPSGLALARSAAQALFRPLQPCLPRFFEALSTEPAGVRAAVQEATSSLASAFGCAARCWMVCGWAAALPA